MNENVQIQVSRNGDTLWVNDAVCCIGRFSKKFGMDVHRTLDDQMNGAPQCLHCTHEAAGPQEWDEFRGRMWVDHGVALDPDLIKFEPQ